MNRHMYNIAIFKNTMSSCVRDEYLKDMIHNSIKNQRVYRENDKVENSERFSDETNELTTVTVTKNRTLEAAANHVKNDYYGKTVVLNFADFYKPGGLVEAGSSAQEEALCRISTLYPCITDKKMLDDFYTPHKRTNIDCLYNNDLIYTPDVVVFRKDDEEMNVLHYEDWYTVDVITCAAPNLRNTKIKDEQLFDIHKSRFMRILEIAKVNKADNVILGAFGCGAFKNDPYVVAHAAKEAMTEFLNNNPFAFKNIEFAVYCTPYDKSNYKAFSETFSEGFLDMSIEAENIEDYYDPYIFEEHFDEDRGDEEENR